MTVIHNSPYSTAGTIAVVVGAYSAVSAQRTLSQFQVALIKVTMRGTEFVSATSAISNGSKSKLLLSSRCCQCSALPCLRQVCSVQSQLSPLIVLAHLLGLTLLEIINMWLGLPALVLPHPNFLKKKFLIVCKTGGFLKKVCLSFQTEMTLL
jgi:hypothetical protein